MRVYTLGLSVIAHALVLTLFVVMPLVASRELPEPRRTVEFVHFVPPTVPSPPPVLRSRERATPQTASSAAAPLEEPRGVAPEADPAPPPFDLPPSLIDGVAFGDGSIHPDPLPPPPTPRDREPIRVGGAVTRPERVRDVPPIYPTVARLAGVEGTVILEAVIGRDGTVDDVRVLRSVPLLDDAAREAVRQWLFTPTRLNGEPVPVVMTVTVTFRLR
jgi:protein TonB